MASLASVLVGIRTKVSTGNFVATEIGDLLTAGPWRPPQWVNATAFAMTATDPVTKKPTAYVFDAVIRAEYDQKTVVTLNPVQTGAPLTDHAYAIPATVVIEVAMSDAMQSFAMDQWADSPSKSISTFQALLALQKQRLPVQLATPLNLYSAMMITGVSATADKDTKHALKAIVTFQQILTASVRQPSNSANSSIPQTTDQTIGGVSQAVAVPASTVAQNNVQSAIASGALTAQQAASVARQIETAGVWSSTNISSLASIFR